MSVTPPVPGTPPVPEMPPVPVVTPIVVRRIPAVGAQGACMPSIEHPISGSVASSRSVRNTRVSTGELSIPAMSPFVAFPAEMTATCLPSGLSAMSTASTIEARAGPLRVVPSRSIRVMQWCTIASQGLGPP